MNVIQALILGIVQGITEFLPVSSSTHLMFAQKLMGIAAEDWLIDFDLICHLGTLMAVLTILWKDVLTILQSFRSMALFSLALLPLIPAYFLLKPLRVLLSDDASVFLLCGSLWMFFASSHYFATTPVAAADGIATQAPVKEATKWHNVLWIGIAQSLALLPGISRSGATISMARMLGWEWKNAARFSFLLSIPTILGGSAIEVLHNEHGWLSIPWTVCIVGLIASFVTGLGALRLLFWMLDKGSLRPFAWYCLAVAIISWVVF